MEGCYVQGGGKSIAEKRERRCILTWKVRHGSSAIRETNLLNSHGFSLPEEVREEFFHLVLPGFRIDGFNVQACCLASSMIFGAWNPSGNIGHFQISEE